MSVPAPPITLRLLIVLLLMVLAPPALTLTVVNPLPLLFASVPNVTIEPAANFKISILVTLVNCASVIVAAALVISRVSEPLVSEIVSAEVR